MQAFSVISILLQVIPCYSLPGTVQWYLNALPSDTVAAWHDPDGSALFEGILPAVGIHTAECTDIQFHHQERQIKYRGAVADVADTLALSAAPGQVSLPPSIVHAFIYI